MSDGWPHRPECPDRPAAMPPDIPWRQRFANFCQALDQLETFFQPPELNERERQGLIKAFEYCFELGWNTLRDLLLAEGNADLIGSRDTLRLAFRVGLIRDGESWLRMVQDCNLTSHTYNRVTAEQVSGQVAQRYLPCFQELRQTLELRLTRTEPEPAGDA
jgi:nucleotidyltransferase substrate binding protein (TIGR01987 family)